MAYLALEQISRKAVVLKLEIFTVLIAVSRNEFPTMHIVA